MSYTSPSPQNVAQNGNQTTWWIPARNLSSVKATNVIVQVNLTPVGGLSPVTYLAQKGVFNFTTGVWQVGELLPGEVKWLKIVTSVADIGLAPYTLTSVISGNGVDPNNVNNTLIQTLTSVVCDPSAGAVGDNNSCYCGDVSLNDTPCTYGVTEWVLNPDTVVNSEAYTWDNATGKYRFTPISLTQDITAQYSIWCGDVEISGPATLTIPALIEDVNQFNHIPINKAFGDLTSEDIAVLETQYPTTNLEDFCWIMIYNGAGEPTGGVPLDCNKEQDTRTFFLCTDDECTVEPPSCVSCPQSNLPNDIFTEVTETPNYVPQIGDTIFLQHPGAHSIHIWNGTLWERNSCGCTEYGEGGGPYPTAITVTGTTTKTVTITMSEGDPISTTFTDLTGESGGGDMDIQHAPCSPSSGAGTLADPLVVTTPVPQHVFPNTALDPGDTSATVFDVGILFSIPCEDGCTPTYTLGGFSTLAYENVTLVGATLTYDVKANAPSGNFPIIINRTCA